MKDDDLHRLLRLVDLASYEHAYIEEIPDLLAADDDLVLKVIAQALLRIADGIGALALLRVLDDDDLPLRGAWERY